MPITATETRVSTKTKVTVGVGLLAIAGLAAYGFAVLNSTSTTKSITPAPEYKPTFIMMKAADAPNDAKVSAGSGVFVAKLAMTSKDVVKWGKPTLFSMTILQSGTASSSTFKNWRLCNLNNTCVTGTVSGNAITFSKLNSLLAKRGDKGFIKTAEAVTIVENSFILTVKVDILSGNKGTLSLSIPSTSYISGFKTTEWVPSSSYLQKAGIVDFSEKVYGETSPQISFDSGSSYLGIGSVVIQ